MTKFEKPGSKDWDYPDMAREAGDQGPRRRRHLRSTTSSRRPSATATATRPAASAPSTSSATTGIPIYNVNNNCSTGSTALFMAKQFVEGGLADCTMALGFEKMEKGSLGMKYTDRTVPMDKHFKAMIEERGFEPKAPGAPQMFGNAGREHMEKYGTTAEQFAKIGWKNHKHSVNNPYSQFQDEYTLEQILERADGLRPAHEAPVLPDLGRRRRRHLASEDFVRKHGLEGRRPSRSLGMAMTTDFSEHLRRRA